MRKLFLISITTVAFILLSAKTEYSATVVLQTSSDRLSLSEGITNTLNIRNVKKYIADIGVLHSNIVIKQVVLETGWLESKLCVNHNNLFGMHYPTKRPTTATGYVIADNGAKVAVYSSWKDSVKDYLLYQQYWKSKGKDLSNYWKFLQSIGYSETSEYVKLLKQIKV